MMIVLLLLLRTLAVWAVDTGRCPLGYEEHPLILISLDGFRAEYLQRNLTPNIQSLKEKGSAPPNIRASNPTVTFPNHYTIVTGLYPESHGIVANMFYDPEFNASFSIQDPKSTERRWWGGEPIWNTATNQGKISGAVYWPGSDANVQGMHPTYYYKYEDDLLTYPQRIDQVLSWLNLPPDSRPSFICAYFEQPDHAGHDYGPHSQQVDEVLKELDSLIGTLIDGIELLGLKDCVNIVVVSDHGMTSTGRKGNVDIGDLVPDLDNMAIVYEGPVGMIYVHDEYKGEIYSIRQNLTCKHPELRQYSFYGLPKRYHYSHNQRIGDIVLPMTLGYEERDHSSWFIEGNHGYDNYYEDMAPIFIAVGPEFRQTNDVESFQNIEIYNLMCELLGLNPAPNNGTEGSLYHLLNSHPNYPPLPKELPPASPPFPDKEQVLNRQHMSGCPGDDSSPLDLNFTSSESDIFLTEHLPWGIPHTGALPASLLLLYQTDHVTGYSQTLKMPLWTSFTLSEFGVDCQKVKWSSDIRLTSQNTATCSDYATLANLTVTMQPLFPPRYGTNFEECNVDFMVSNAVPIGNDVLLHWHHLTEDRLHQWVAMAPNPINVMVGPLFDRDADSLVDDFTTLKLHPAIPSHLFLVATRCLVPVKSDLNSCPPEELDSIAFIYPQHLSIPNCLDEDEFALEFSAKVRDVELATGLTLFPKLPPEDRTRLALRIHTTLWPTNFQGHQNMDPNYSQNLG